MEKKKLPDRQLPVVKINKDKSDWMEQLRPGGKNVVYMWPHLEPVMEKASFCQALDADIELVFPRRVSPEEAVDGTRHKWLLHDVIADDVLHIFVLLL